MIMQIVMCYTAGDGCTYSCDVALPIEYESVEKALVDFEDLCTMAFAKKDWRERKFTFCGREYDPSDFFFPSGERQEPALFPPDFLTVDEWFAKHGARA
jgi:hypothetical protein